MTASALRIYEGDSEPAAFGPLGIDELVRLTPPTRDRYVDALRAFAICVVVMWHWVLSITHWRAGEGGAPDRLVMPNPLDVIPAGWSFTWVLQVMPLFFIVGGFANTAAWSSASRSGVRRGVFARRRLVRMGRPVAVLLGGWVVVSVLLQHLVGGRFAEPVWSWGRVLFVPLWFVAIYGVISAVSPWLVDAARLVPVWAHVAVLVAVVAIADTLRLAAGIPLAGWVSTIGTWTACHQLGVWWRVAELDVRRVGRKLTVAAAGLGGLIICTQTFSYPHSMVAVASGGGRSNMFPTSLPICFLAIFQLGLVLLARPRAAPLLERRSVWKPVVLVNGVAMTVLVWHMTAWLCASLVFEALGGRLGSAATTGWWLQRPLWFALPGVFLAVLVKVVVRFERPNR